MKVYCVKCHQPKEISVTETQLKEWKNSGKLIQDVMPNVPAREMLLSGYCNECFERLFSLDQAWDAAASEVFKDAKKDN